MKEKDIVRCLECGEVLTSERSINHYLGPRGQRCRWKKFGRRKRSGPHMKEDVDFIPMGTKVTSGVIVMYVQSRLGDWE